MKKILLTLALFLISNFSFSQKEGSIARIVKAYDSTSIVAFGERHDQIELIEYYKTLVNDKSFQEKVDDIVLELGNSFYQEILDKYISGKMCLLKTFAMYGLVLRTPSCNLEILAMWKFS